MRLIDADALINDILTDYGCDPKYIADETIDGLKPYTDQLILERIGLQPTIAAPRWHRVEDEPKESGKQYVVWASKGYAYCDKWLGDRWLISSVAPETVTYWMPIEPPKEDA